MADIIDNSWTYAVAYLEFTFDSKVLASGSGFFWSNQAGETFLVSNWHNFAGRSPKDGQPLSKKLAIPDAVNALVYQKASPPGEDGKFNLKVVKLTVSLVNAESGENLWFEHPTLGRNADIAAIRLDGLQEANLALNPANTLETDCGEKFYVSQDVFILGYPLGLGDQSIPVPVWKRGTIATEPYINQKGKPIIYIDTASRQGMSGAIVITKDTIYGQYKKKDGSIVERSLISKHHQILGVYSGRLGPHQLEAQLGIVWKRDLLDELIAGKKLADTGLG